MARISDLRNALADLVCEAALPRVLGKYATVPDSLGDSSAALIVSTGTPFAPNYSLRMGRSRRTVYRFELLILTGRLNEQTAQGLLDEFASGDSPIILALLARNAIDGADITDLVGQDVGATRVGNTEYLGFSLVVELEA